MNKTAGLFATTALICSAALPAAAQTAAPATQIEEVVVTAQKRSEDVRKLPESVTAFTAAALQATGAQTLQDFISDAPGVIFDQGIPQKSNITMRGIGTATEGLDQGQGTTAILLDDVPLTDPGYAVSIPDIDVFDLQRVEVLKGPQGAIFGTAALGGAVNFITTPVSLTAYDLKAEAGLSSTAHSGDLGYRTNAAINVPIINDALGLRLTVAHHDDPGYIDNVGTGQKDSNSSQEDQVRANVLWKITDKASFDLLGFYDHTHLDDEPDADVQMGPYTKSTVVPEYANYVTTMGRLKFNYDLGFANFSISAAVSQKKNQEDFDYSPYYGSPTVDYEHPGIYSTYYESRLVSPTGQRFEWLLGVYHGEEKESYPGDTYQGAVDVDPYATNYRSTETSGFGQFTYHLLDSLKLSAGGRYYDIKLNTMNIFYDAPSQNVTGLQHSTGFSPNGSITYEPNSNVLVYGLISTGFREGGVNLLLPLAGFAQPATYKPDSLINYEVGLRTTWFDHRLTFDVTPFYIDWNDIQVRLKRPDHRAYVANAAAATSMGVENSLHWRPASAWDFQANVTYLDAQLSQTTNVGLGTVLPKGERIPGSAPWSLNESATYHWDLPHEPYVTISHRYVSQTLDGFLGSPANPVNAPPVGNYNVVDLRAGAKFNKFDVDLYATNIADTRGVTASDWFAGYMLQDYYIRPRTIGVLVDWRY